MTEWQRHRARENARAFLRFSVTVVCSALLSAWLQQNWGSLRSGWRQVTASLSLTEPRRPTATRTAGINSLPPRPKISNESYGRYFEDAIGLLRSDRNVRLVKLEMPRELLSYQENAVIRAGYRLQTNASRVPMLAVSRNAHEFLTTMRITFIDPREVPEHVLQSAGPLGPEQLAKFLLVPDVSGANASLFAVARK